MSLARRSLTGLVLPNVSTALVCLGLGLVGASLLATRPRRRERPVRLPGGGSAGDRALREVIPDPAEQITG